MWIALLIFCVFLLFVAFFLYGLTEWENLLIEPEENISIKKELPHPYGRFVALWMLLIGLSFVSMISAVLEWLEK